MRATTRFLRMALAGAVFSAVLANAADAPKAPKGAKKPKSAASTHKEPHKKEAKAPKPKDTPPKEEAAGDKSSVTEGLLNKLLAPGPLIEGHHDLEKADCLKCHTPREGIPDAKCMD